MATGTAGSLDTPFMPFLVGLLVNMPGLVNECRENLALVMEKWFVEIWQAGQFGLRDGLGLLPHRSVFVGSRGLLSATSGLC